MGAVPWACAVAGRSGNSPFAKAADGARHARGSPSARFGVVTVVGDGVTGRTLLSRPRIDDADAEYRRRPGFRPALYVQSLCDCRLDKRLILALQAIKLGGQVLCYSI